MSSPAIFEAFNARSLEPGEIAKTFVPPAQYRSLTSRSHTLVLGPRGSGKTTLLRMLQGVELEHWDHSEANEFRNLIDYTGVFIPSDRVWSGELATIGGSSLSIQDREVFGLCAFTTHVLHSLVDSMWQRTRAPYKEGSIPHRRVDLSLTNEVDFVVTLADAWSLDSRSPTLLGLKHALARRLLDLSQLATEFAIQKRNRLVSGLPHDRFLYLDFLSATEFAVELFDDLAKESTGKWALLFDEVELAPSFIHQKIFPRLRSSHPKLIFKISLNMFSGASPEIADELSPMPGHDYKIVNLAYDRKEDSYLFCKDLMDSFMKSRGLQDVAPEEVFGESEFGDIREESDAPYRRGSPEIERFIELSETDATFADYLQSRHLDLDNVAKMSEARRAAEIRKIRSLVIVRQEFRTVWADIPTQRRLRSRKIPKVYGGASSLFAMVEGNPRWFRGIVFPLLSSFRPAHGSVSGSRQTAEVLEAVRTFRSLLKTVGNRPGPHGTTITVLSIIDKIGAYFFKRIVLDAFSPDAPLTFSVNSDMNKNVLDALRHAVNSGALVYIPGPDDAELPTDLRRKRFRLSYVFAPYYHLPIVMGRSVSLRTILAQEALEMPRLFE